MCSQVAQPPPQPMWRCTWCVSLLYEQYGIQQNAKCEVRNGSSDCNCKCGCDAFLYPSSTFLISSFSPSPTSVPPSQLGILRIARSWLASPRWLTSEGRQSKTNRSCCPVLQARYWIGSSRIADVVWVVTVKKIRLPVILAVGWPRLEWDMLAARCSLAIMTIGDRRKSMRGLMCKR